MNILTRLSGAIESTNQMEMESASIIGFFTEARACPDGRNTPAYGSFLRRRNRNYRHR